MNLCREGARERSAVVSVFFSVTKEGGCNLILVLQIVLIVPEFFTWKNKILERSYYSVLLKGSIYLFKKAFTGAGETRRGEARFPQKIRVKFEPPGGMVFSSVVKVEDSF